MKDLSVCFNAARVCGFPIVICLRDPERKVVLRTGAGTPLGNHFQVYAFLVMHDSSFEHVMITSPRSGMVLNVTSVLQASELLAHCWTKRCGPKHAAASDACSKALRGEQSADEARVAFIDAAKEIDVYVMEKTQAMSARSSVENKVNSSAFAADGEHPIPRRDS
jgi:hypothetical protein